MLAVHRYNVALPPLAACVRTAKAFDKSPPSWFFALDQVGN